MIKSKCMINKKLMLAQLFQTLNKKNKLNKSQNQSQTKEKLLKRF